MSRLHRVLAVLDGEAVVEDLDGVASDVALLALDGAPPVPGDWLVVHSGYAIDRATPTDAASARSALGKEER